ncbi:MAG: LysE family translocator [Sphingobacteriia bacterium]|jgi:threonine/homoserine/homoserine lactone efflux protein|nr:LysE family translocator [Paludibacteraceae bacterium]NCA78617.1 LysE family translocator [Sphingobacteriia bacterium]
MFNIIITGIIIGLFVSVPVGPLGILCIQRTLNRGRAHGIITGLGATTSDLIYAMLVGFSMSIIINFIEAYQLLIQIIGSVIICGFGIHVFRSNPSKQLASSAKKKSKGDYFSDYFSAFALCFSNPLIIFLFIGLFAQFHFFSPEQNFYEDFIGLISILLGAFLWWAFLTLIVSKFRNQFNMRGLWILNKITGSILIVLGAGGVLFSIFDSFL